MLVKILKTFPYSTDGVTSRELSPSEVDGVDVIEEVLDAYAPGLIAEGFCEAAPAGAVATVTDAELLEAATDDELKALYKAKTTRNPARTMTRDDIIAELKG